MIQTAIDYRIYQRRNGYAKVRFDGIIPEQFFHCYAVFARVSREDDNLTVIPWTQCQREGNQWMIDLDVPEGGLYRLEACVLDSQDSDFDWTSKIKIVKHIGVGELFLITGQSNMAGYGRDAAFDPPTIGVHLYANNGKWDIASHPLNDSTDSIYPENYEMSSSSSPALSFGRMVSRILNLPVGLVQASLGGSPLKSWHPEEDGTLYRAMLRRLDAVGEIGNILWHQGCSDTSADDAEQYYDRFCRMIELWRKQLGDIPIVTVQLNRRVAGSRIPENNRYWGLVRDAQRRAARILSKVVVIPSTDLTINDGIHNSAIANVAIGERMARAYLGEFFGYPPFKAPDIEAAQRMDDSTLRLIFRDCDALTFLDPYGSDFDVEDESGMIPCISAEKSGKNIVLKTQRPFKEGAVVHGCWRQNPSIHAPRGIHGMPMLSFYNVEIH